MEKGTSRRREKEGGPAGGGVIRERCGRSCGQPFQESEKGIAAVSNAQPGVSGRRTNTDRTGGLGEPVPRPRTKAPTARNSSATAAHRPSAIGHSPSQPSPRGNPQPYVTHAPAHNNTCASEAWERSIYTTLVGKHTIHVICCAPDSDPPRLLQPLTHSPTPQ